MELKYKSILSESKLSPIRDLSFIEEKDTQKVFSIGFTDNKGTEIFQGDILKIAYVEATSFLFERMKEKGDDFIYIIFDVESEYFGFTYRTHDEREYFTGGSTDIRFLRYLLESKKCAEIVGNIIEDKEFYLKITRQTKEDPHKRRGRLERVKDYLNKEIEITLNKSELFSFIEPLFDVDNDEDMSYYNANKEKTLTYLIRANSDNFLAGRKIVRHALEDLNNEDVFIDRASISNECNLDNELILTVYLNDEFRV